jgi:quinol-cytochrome oxidoreductase complex cytochrome b subunit
MVNGTELGARTLPFFYTLHTAVIPILLAGLMGFHFWRIRKAGGLVVPRKPDEPVDDAQSEFPFPNLLLREVSTALMVTAAVLVFSIFFDAALSAPANPGLSPNPVRAPWYFAGFQELLLHRSSRRGGIDNTLFSRTLSARAFLTWRTPDPLKAYGLRRSGASGSPSKPPLRPWSSPPP